jgi:hypothetical protein
MGILCKLEMLNDTETTLISYGILKYVHLWIYLISFVGPISLISEIYLL